MDRTRAAVTVWITTVALLFGQAQSQQQQFRVTPANTNVTEGQTAVLHCEISNLAGAVQWAKDGFVLGYDPQIPGFPRYTIIGDKTKGEFNLRIENAQIDDDGEYQCQVGPTADNQAIRTDAKLSVLLAPTTVEFVERPTGGTVEIRQGETLDIACVVKGGKPAATIKWYRKNNEIRIENADCRPENIDGKRQNMKCRINLKPSPEDNGAIYACEANHPALAQPIRAQIKLSVLYPPGLPEIEGYQEGEVIKMGDLVTLSCKSKGGNPLAQLVWFKNDAKIDLSYHTSGSEAENKYDFIVDATDNNAVYKCEASNNVSPEPLSTSVKLMVQFAPSRLTITGPKEAKEGDTLTMICSTDKSNPAADVSWVVDGVPIPAKSAVTAAREGGWITTSEVTVPVTAKDRSMMFSCYAVHQALGSTKVNSTIVNVLYPPNAPTIYGFNDSVQIRAGNLQRLTCFSMGGNPFATLSWFKGDSKIPSTNSINGNLASAEIAIVTDASDNGAEYRCEATNSATQRPLSVSIKLAVLFPPSGVIVKMSPKTPKAGKKITLQCDSASSNPESSITWWRGGYLIQGKSNGTFDAPHGGKSTRSILKLDVTSADDGAVYTCQATNELLQLSVHDAVTLNVLYKPEFWSPLTEVVNVLENETALINLTARANPSAINYTWVKKHSPGESGRVFSHGPILNISEVKKQNSGVYLCEAKNDEGTTKVNVTLNVQYPPQIVKITSTFMVELGSQAHMECEVDANPKLDKFVKWKRDGYDMSRGKQSMDGSKSFFTISKVTKDDSGMFNCVANNGIGEEAKLSTTLIVKFQPIINTQPQYQKAASEKDQTARLICRVEGAPKVSFTWSKEASVINTNGGSNKYRTITSQVSLIVWESELFVSDVVFSDYGPYECVARNEMGVASTKIQLYGTSKPDTPLALKVVNSSHNTAWLLWAPGFDGGVTQSFRIRYKKSDDGEPYRYTDVFPSNTTSFGVSGLELGTEYIFSIMAFNSLGESAYSTDIVKGKTQSEIPPSEQKTTLPPYMYEKGEVPRIIIIAVSVVGTFLLVLNVFLVVCFIQRRRKKRMEEAAESDQSSSKTAATIEMYAPSSYNGTVTGETLSSISEKSESYSDENSIDDYNDESTSKVAATTYLTDRPETMVSTVYPVDNSQYLTVRDANPGSRQNTLTRSQKVNNNQNVYEHENETYADELRRNAYNQNLGDNKVTTYTKAPASPTKPPLRDGYYNMTPDSRYIPYPPALTSPQRQQPPVLTTFNPNPPNTSPTQSQPNNLPPELQGHLV